MVTTRLRRPLGLSPGCGIGARCRQGYAGATMTRALCILRNPRSLPGPFLWGASLAIALLVPPSTGARAETASAATDESRADAGVEAAADAAADADDRARALPRLRTGTPLRVEVMGRGRLEGQFVAASTETLILAQSEGFAGIPIAEIQALRVRGR